MRGSARGLRHDASPEAFAAAIMRCRGGDPGRCSFHGECQRESSCVAGKEVKEPDELAALQRRIERLERHIGLAGLLLLLLLTGCAAGDIAVGVTVTDHALAEVIHEHAHNCMCVPDGRTKQWFWCDENGKRDDDGEYACCYVCEKNCGKIRERRATK